MGFYCVDNLPVELMRSLRSCTPPAKQFRRAALLVDAREGVQLEKLRRCFKHLKKDHPSRSFSIEANEDALLRRYSETPPPHPPGKNYSCARGLSHERA